MNGSRVWFSFGVVNWRYSLSVMLGVAVVLVVNWMIFSASRYDWMIFALYPVNLFCVVIAGMFEGVSLVDVGVGVFVCVCVCVVCVCFVLFLFVNLKYVIDSTVTDAAIIIAMLVVFIMKIDRFFSAVVCHVAGGWAVIFRFWLPAMMVLKGMSRVRLKLPSALVFVDAVMSVSVSVTVVLFSGFPAFLTVPLIDSWVGSSTKGGVSTSRVVVSLVMSRLR